MGEANALGESTAGVVGFGHEEHEPTEGAAGADLEIRAFVLMGEVKVALTDGPVVSISEAVRDALRTVASGVARGLVQGSAPQRALQAGADDGMRT
jgi:hypothetical protein